MAKTTKRYRWDGTLPFVPNPANLLSTTGGANRRLDPDLELPYTDEFVVGLDQQVASDTTVRFNYVRKLERNRMKLQNTAIPFAAYNIPVAFTDRGRDFASSRRRPRAHALQSRPRVRGPAGGPADQRSAVHRRLRHLQPRGREAPHGQVADPDRLRRQPLRHVGLRVGDLAGHRHRYGQLRRAAGSQPPHLQQPSGLLALAVQVPGQLRAAVGDLVVGVDPVEQGRAVRAHAQHDRPRLRAR